MENKTIPPMYPLVFAQNGIHMRISPNGQSKAATVMI